MVEPHWMELFSSSRCEGCLSSVVGSFQDLCGRILWDEYELGIVYFDQLVEILFWAIFRLDFFSLTFHRQNNVKNVYMIKLHS